MQSLRAGLIRIALGAALLSVAPAAQAHWLRAETPHFVLYSDGSERSLRDYATVVEDYDALLHSLFGLGTESSPNKLSIYLVGDASELKRFSKLPSGALGYYSANASGIVAFATRGSETVEGLSGQQVLLHEYAHHFMLQYFPSAYPRWYVEGFAEYLMTAQFKPKTIEYGSYNLNRATWLVNGGWLPLKQILNDNQKHMSDSSEAMFYAQSWLIVHYFYRDAARNAEFQNYIHDVVQGKDRDAAFTAAFHMTYDQAAVKLRSYLEGRLTYSQRKRASDRIPVPITVSTLPAAADDLLIPAAKLTQGVAPELRPGLLAAIRRGAAKYPADPFAQRVLAQAEVQLGNRAAGQAMLNTLLAGDGKTDAWLQYLRGMSVLLTAQDLQKTQSGDAATRRVEARKFFARAHKLDDNQYQALYRYGETFATESGKPTENTVNVMLLAHNLAPQVSEISVNTARLMLAREQYVDAKALLEPVAANPHGGDEADEARKLLDQLTKLMPVAAATVGVPPTAPPAALAGK